MKNIARIIKENANRKEITKILLLVFNNNINKYLGDLILSVSGWVIIKGRYRIIQNVENSFYTVK